MVPAQSKQGSLLSFVQGFQEAGQLPQRQSEPEKGSDARKIPLRFKLIGF